MESEENLYAEMRATIRADQERAARRRAEHRPAEPSPPTPPAAEPPEAEPARGLRRWLGGRRQSF